ncbi:type VI secretion system baseplate subunit TssK [Caballeronia zhejiangensis]|uniref:type VI secretion system baseplate subunit TssK n=1 Tax=Caballeronia zhejiangensis TaxID=871203 RepID=UPI001F4C62BA|nr:type VI secretion system baseplate subunit TssK [Caballeronia zhejiangensis]
MKITRPLWAQGVFMTPQHFQQQALWEQLANARIAEMASPDPWGVIDVAVDKQALGIDRVQFTKLVLRLPDGTLIDSDTSDWLPAARSLDDVGSQYDAITVLAGVALVDAQGGNCIEPGAKPARPRRFVREYLHVADLYGEGKEEISVERHAVSLLFDFEAGGDYVTCPVARFIRNAQGRFELDAAFVPPCLFLSANTMLTTRMKRLSEILSAKSASLAVRRRERSDQIADYAVADVSLFWLLHSVNSSWPELARLVQAPNQHPERLYALLSRLAGSLLTFSTTETLVVAACRTIEGPHRRLATVAQPSMRRAGLGPVEDRFMAPVIVVVAQHEVRFDPHADLRKPPARVHERPPEIQLFGVGMEHVGGSAGRLVYDDLSLLADAEVLAMRRDAQRRDLVESLTK